MTMNALPSVKDIQDGLQVFVRLLVSAQISGILSVLQMERPSLVPVMLSVLVGKFGRKAGVMSLVFALFNTILSVVLMGKLIVTVVSQDVRISLTPEENALSLVSVQRTMIQFVEETQ